MSDETHQIEISVAGRSYTIAAADANEQALIERAAAKLQQQIEAVKQSYKVSNPQESLGMAALLLALDVCRHEQAADRLFETRQEVEYLDNLLNDFLQGEDL